MNVKPKSSTTGEGYRNIQEEVARRKEADYRAYARQDQYDQRDQRKPRPRPKPRPKPR